MTRRKVLLTGAAGTISSQLLPALRERYDLVCLDVTNDAGHGVIDDVVIADLANPDIDAYREHFAGVDAVIHNGFTWSPDRTLPCTTRVTPGKGRTGCSSRRDSWLFGAIPRAGRLHWRSPWIPTCMGKEVGSLSGPAIVWRHREKATNGHGPARSPSIEYLTCLNDRALRPGTEIDAGGSS